MKVTIGSDHRGLAQRKVLAAAIEALGHEVDDQGSFTEDPCDYPDIAVTVCERIISGESDRGILVCGTGIGMSIAANKTMAVRAALCHDTHAAEMSRRHNDANVLCLSADHLDTLAEAEFDGIIQTWMSTDFEGGRHQRRVDKITSGVDSACHE